MDNTDSGAESLLELNASDAATDFLKEYGEYTLATKFPSLIDGLKSVHRHILLTVGTRVENAKVNAIVGSIMARHPHGDQSIGDALIRMAQPFNNAFPLVWIQGNVGSYSGESPADGRYLDVQSSEFTRDVYFNGINSKTFVYVTSRSGKGTEPLFLIPKIPMALLTGSFAIAVAFSTTIPPFNFVNLCKLTKEYIRKRDSLAGIDKELCIPDYFTPGIIRNAKAVMNAYKQNQFDYPVVVDGLLTITPSTISLRALPPGTPGNSINDVFETIRMSMRDKDSKASEWFQEMRNRSTSRTVNKDGSVSMTNMEADYLFVLKRGLNPFSILPDLKKMVKFTANRRPRIMGLDATGSMKDVSFFELLEIWYQARRRSILSDLCYIQNDLIEEYRRLEALIIIKGHDKEITELFSNSPTEHEVIRYLSRRFRLSHRQAQYIGRLRLNQLTREGVDNLQKQLVEIKEKLSLMKIKFQNVDQQMIDEVTELEKKYGPISERRARLSHYKGYVKVPGGVIQFWDDDELTEIVDAWKSENCEIHYYQRARMNCYAISGDNIESNESMDFPKDIPCDRMVAFTNRPYDTIILRDGKILRFKGLVSKSPGLFQFVGPKCLTIGKTSTVNIIQSSEIPQRKSADGLGIISDVVHVHNCPDDEVVVVHVNSKEPNILRLQWVSHGSKLKRSPVGTLEILGVYGIHESPVVNIPKNILSRIAVYHIKLPEVRSILSQGESVMINISKKNDGNFSLNKHKDTGIYHLSIC